MRINVSPATDHLSQLLSRIKDAVFAGLSSPSPGTDPVDSNVDLVSSGSHHDIVKKFPPQPVAEFLTSCCYELATDSFFYFDQQDFSVKLHNFYRAENCSLRNDSVFICLSLMVFALGSQFAHLKSDDSTSTPGTVNQPGSYFYRLANHITPTVAFCCSIDAVQACLVTAVYLLPEHAYDKAYLYLSHAVRISIALDLHRQKESPHSTPKGCEVRRRLWWSVFSLDRTISIKLGRPKSIASDIIRTPLPTPLLSLDSELSFNNVSHQIANAKLVLMMDVIADNVSQGIPNTSKECDMLDGFSRRLISWKLSLAPQLELQSIVPRSEGYRAVLHLHLNYHFAWILTCRSALIKLLRRRLRVFFNEPDEQQYGCILPLERYAGQCVEAAKAIIDLFETLQRLRYLGIFSYTDFQGCSTATVVLILDCMYQGRTPNSHFVQTGLSCLEFMAIGNQQAKTGLRFVKELQCIAEDVSEKYRLTVINQSDQVGVTSGVEAYEHWVKNIGTDGLTAPAGISESTSATVADSGDASRDMPVGSPSNGVDDELTNELYAGMNQSASTETIPYDDVYLFGLTGLDALDYLNVDALSHSLASLHQVLL